MGSRHRGGGGKLSEGTKHLTRLTGATLSVLAGCGARAIPRFQRRVAKLVKELMSARRDVSKFKGDWENLAHALSRVDAAKIALGERGPVCWRDGAPDFKRAHCIPHANGA